jgi:biotin operon repressor
MLLNSSLLSVQRTKNLVRDYGTEQRKKLTERLEWIGSAIIETRKDLRWRSFIRNRNPAKPKDVALVRRRASTSGTATSSRSASTEKIRAVRARLTEPATLLVRLRLAFGVGLKADVIGLLLAERDQWVTVREIALALGYSQVSVRSAVDDLAQAGIVLTQEPQPAAYRIQQEPWNSLFRIDAAPGWQNWHRRFAFVSAFLHWADTVQARPLSTYAFGVHGRALLERYGSVLQHELVSGLIRFGDDTDGASFVSRVTMSFAGSLERYA